MHTRALEIRQAIFDRDPASPAARRAIARSCSALADFHARRKDWPKVVVFRERERTLFQEAVRSPRATDDDRRNLALSDKTLGAVLQVSGRPAEARPLFDEAIALDEARANANPSSDLARMDLSFSLGSLGALRLAEGDLEGSRSLFERALALREAVANADPANAWAKAGVARAHARLADIEEGLGHRNAAEAHRALAHAPER